MQCVVTVQAKHAGKNTLENLRRGKARGNTKIVIAGAISALPYITQRKMVKKDKPCRLSGMLSAVSSIRCRKHVTAVGSVGSTTRLHEPTNKQIFFHSVLQEGVTGAAFMLFWPNKTSFIKGCLSIQVTRNSAVCFGSTACSLVASVVIYPIQKIRGLNTFKRPALFFASNHIELQSVVFTLALQHSMATRKNVPTWPLL